MAGAAPAARRHRCRARAEAEPVPAEYGDLHQAVLTGFLGNIGALDERREYEGARGSAVRDRAGNAARVQAAEVGRCREPDGDDAALRAHGRGGRAAVDRGGRRTSAQAQLQRAALGRGARLRRRVRIDCRCTASRCRRAVGSTTATSRRRKRARSSCARRWSKGHDALARERSSITIDACDATSRPLEAKLRRRDVLVDEQSDLRLLPAAAAGRGALDGRAREGVEAAPHHHGGAHARRSDHDLW